MVPPGGRGPRMTSRHQPPYPGGRLCRIPGLAEVLNGGVTARAARYATPSLVLTMIYYDLKSNRQIMTTGQRKRYNQLTLSMGNIM